MKRCVCCPPPPSRAYDRVALILRGEGAELNLPLHEYQADPILEAMRRMSKKNMVEAVRNTKDEEVGAGVWKNNGWGE